LAPHKIAGIADVRAVATGRGFGVAAKSDGSVWSWGSTLTGATGPGDEDEMSARVAPRPIPNLLDVKAIACGNWHNLALKNDGAVWAWGNHSTGQLGDGSKDTRNAPLPIAFP